MTQNHYYNEICLQGKIHNIQFSHESNSKQYYKAIITTEDNQNFQIKFREDKLNDFKENEKTNLFGNLRLFNRQLYIYVKDIVVDVSNEFVSCQVKMFGSITKKDERFHSYVVYCGGDTYIPVKSNNDYEINQDVNIQGLFTSRQFTKKNSSEVFTTYEVLEDQE